MAVGFSGIPFQVRLDDVARLPYPTIQDSGEKTYEAEIYVAGSSDVDALLAFQRKITVHPAIGAIDSGSIIIEGSGAFGSLVIPLDEGDEGTWRAALRSAAPLPSDVSGLWLMSVVFVCGSRVS